VLKQLFIILSICFVFGLVLLYFFQRHLIYHPNKLRPNLADYHATDMSIVSLHTQDNMTLSAWYKAAQANQPTVLLLHGNAGHVGNRMPLAKHFIAAGYGVLLLEYRGYGGNMGSPTEQGLYADGRAALQFLHQQGITAQQIVIFGESLGTAVATQLASEATYCCVILQSPFTSLVNLARLHYPWALIKPKDRFDSLSRIDAIHAPLLILHGKIDKLVPLYEGQALFDKALEPKQILIFEDKSHNDLWNEAYYAAVIQFINAQCLRSLE
jgi:fermentation-respiration switch protein FrsA (DUF1100 family)